MPPVYHVRFYPLQLPNCLLFGSISKSVVTRVEVPREVLEVLRHFCKAVPTLSQYVTICHNVCSKIFLYRISTGSKVMCANTRRQSGRYERFRDLLREVQSCVMHVRSCEFLSEREMRRRRIPDAAGRLDPLWILTYVDCLGGVHSCTSDGTPVDCTIGTGFKCWRVSISDSFVHPVHRCRFHLNS